MEENSMDEFFDALDEGYQSEEEAAEEETSTPEEDAISDDAPQEAESDPESGEKSEEASEPSGEEKAASETPDTRTYVLRVNHEDKTVTHEELLSYAQQGVDYSRVKTQLEQAKRDNDGLSAKVAEMQTVWDAMNEIATASHITVDDMLRQFEESRYKGQGMSDAEAKLAVERDRYKKERDTLQNKAKPTEAEELQERANRDVTEFSKKFPDVKLDEVLISKLSPDLQNGMSLSDAYQKMQRTEQDEKIRKLEADLAAERQNAANRQSSPGSLNDGGTKRKKDMYDDFFDNY